MYTFWNIKIEKTDVPWRVQHGNKICDAIKMGTQARKKHGTGLWCKMEKLGYNLSQYVFNIYIENNEHEIKDDMFNTDIQDLKNILFPSMKLE